MTQATPRPASTWLHLYNLDGRHAFSTVLDPSLRLSPLQLQVQSSLRSRFPGLVVSHTISVLDTTFPEVPTAALEAGVFTWGPLAGLWITSPDHDLGLRLDSFFVVETWQTSSPGLDDGLMSGTSADVIVAQQVRA